MTSITEVKPGVIKLDNPSIELIQGLKTRQKYELAVDKLKSSTHLLPFDVLVKSRLSDTATANPPIYEDVATVEFHDKNRTAQTFTRKPHWLYGLESPKRFLKRVLKDCLNPVSNSK